MVDAFQKALRVYPQNISGTTEYTMVTGGLVHVMEALQQIMTAVLTPIGEFAAFLAKGISSIQVTREQVEALYGRFANAIPVLAGFATGVSAVGANSLLALPGLNMLGLSISPVLTGLLTFVLMSSEVRDSLVNLVQTLKPVMEAFIGLGGSVSKIVVEFVGYLVPAVVALVDALAQMLTPLAQFLSESERGRTVLVGLVATFVALKAGALTTFASFATRGVAAFRSVFSTIAALTVGTNQASAAMHRLSVAHRAAAVAAGIKTAAVRVLTAALRTLIGATGIGLVIVGFTMLVDWMMKAWEANGAFVDAVVKGGNILIGAFEFLINAAIRFFNLFLPKNAEMALVTLSRINRELIGVGKTLEDVADGSASDVDWSHLDNYIASATEAGAATDYLGQAMDKFRQQMERLNRTVYDFGRWVNEVTDFRDPMSKAMDEVAYQTQKFDEAMQDATKTGDELVTAFTDMAAKIRSELGSALQYARNQLDAAQREFDSFAKSVSDSIVNVMSMRDALSARDGLEQAFADLKQSAAGALTSMLDFRQLVSIAPSKAYVGFVRALGEALDALGSDADDTFLGRLRQRRDQMVEFGETMRNLAEMGLSEAGIRQVMGAGYEAGLEIGRQLIEGGLDAVAEANQILGDMFDLADEVGASVAADYYDLGGGMGEALLAGLTEQAEKAADFAARIRQLVELGLSPTAIRQVLAAGVDAGIRIADSLIDGGVTIVDEVNRLYDATAQVAAQTGEFGAEAFFREGIKTAKAFVDALVGQIRAEIPRLDRVLLQVAERLEALARQDAAAMRDLAGAGAAGDIDIAAIGRDAQSAMDASLAEYRERIAAQDAERARERFAISRGEVRADFARTQGTQARVNIENQYVTINELTDMMAFEQQMAWMLGDQRSVQ
jgi:hypothetical protein